MTAILIIAHGQPSDPQPAAVEIAVLAAKVQRLLPGFAVTSVTLAEAGGLQKSVAALGARGTIYPLFMAGGWFTNSRLPQLLQADGGSGWRLMLPFGCDPAVQALAVTLAREAAETAGFAPEDGKVLLAAHGSSRSAAPAEVAQAVARKIRLEAGFATCDAAFIDQSPRIAEMRGYGAAALCLPFFAAAGGHVGTDLPAALLAAGFGGHVAAPLGLDARVPGLIADAILRQAADAP